MEASRRGRDEECGTGELTGSHSLSALRALVQVCLLSNLS